MTDAGHMSGGAPVTPAPPMAEPTFTVKAGTYTLEEARQVLNERKCAHDGHDHNLLVNGAGDLIAIHCGRCGAKWEAVPV